MKKLLFSLAVIASGFAAQASGTWYLGGTKFTVDTLFHATTGPGVTTTGLRLSGSVTTNVFYSTIDLTNPDLTIRGVKAGDTSTGWESVANMGTRAAGKGYGTPLSGVNGDFFNNGTGQNRLSCGNTMADGKVWCTYGDQWWQNNASYAVVANQKDFFIEQAVYPCSSLTFPDGQQHYASTNSSWVSDNSLCIYTSAFGASTGMNEWGRECRMKLVSGSLTNYNAVFEVTSAVVGDMSGKSEHNLSIPSGGYVLAGKGSAYTMMGQLKVGDRISMTAGAISTAGTHTNVHTVIGGMSFIVIDGVTAPSNYLTLLDHFGNNQARTAIGYNKDKTKMIMLVADKYSSLSTTSSVKKTYGSTSTGFAMTRLSQVMMALGCHTAMAFDGGGSSQLWNNKLGTRNVPYGADYLRPVANGLFAVSTAPADNTVAAIEVVKKNIRLSSGGTFTPTVYAYNKYGVLINTNLTGFTFKVASALGSVSGTKFTANSTKGATIGVVTYGKVSCGVRIITNGGGSYYSSGNDKAPLEVVPYYTQQTITPTPDPEPEPEPEPVVPTFEKLNIAERWHFVNTNYNDGWDDTAPDWSSEDAIKSKSCPRFATGRNGCLYTVDMKTMSIAEINYKGELKPLYKLPPLTEKYNGVDDYYGAAISSDDAGNFLIGHMFTKEDSYRVWTIYSPSSGKAKHFAIDRGSDLSNGRIDNIGRVVGDLTHDAYVFIAPKATGSEASQHTLMLHFTGSGNVSGVTVTPTFGDYMYLAGTGKNFFTTCQPKYTSVSDIKTVGANNAFYWYSKIAGVGQWDVDLFTRENGKISTNYALAWNNYSGLNGFDTFTLADRRYFVVNYASETESATNSAGQHIIVKDEDGNTVAEWNNPDYKTTVGYNTITAIPVDENNVDIYVYNCAYKCSASSTGAIAGALLRVSNEDIEYQAPVAATPAVTPSEELNIKERWNFVNTDYNDSWDATAPDWSSSDAIKSASCPRFATGRNGCLYTLDMKTMSIAEITYDGSFKPLYKLPALTGEYDGIADYYGSAISSDDEGNFLIGHMFTKADSYRVWTIYSPKSGKAKHFTVDLGDEKSGGRIDNIGRVIGDLTRNAYAFVAPQATGSLETQKALILHFTGDGKIDNVSLDSSFDGGLYLSGSGNHNSICQPKYASIYEMNGKDAKNSFYWYSKMVGAGQWSVNLMTRNDSGWDVYIGSKAWDNHSGLNGFDTFTLGGKRYFAVNFTHEEEVEINPSGQHVVVFDENGNSVAEWEHPTYMSAAGYNTITAEPVDENNVNLYIYNCTGSAMSRAGGSIAGAMLRISNQDYIEDEEPNEGTTPGVINIITETEEYFDEPDVYYNLQGIKVTNPSDGIYIRRHGSKADKVFVK